MIDLNNLRVGVHQFNTITGDIEGNFEKIKGYILSDHNSNTDLSVFPETAITGYMCGSLWDRSDFVTDQRSKVDEIQTYVKKIGYRGTVILGAVDVLGSKSNGFPHLKNAAFIINKNNIGVYHKQLLASADHHEDKKYFDRGDETKVFLLDLPNVGKVKVGVPVCEDAWKDSHKRNIPREMVQDLGADLLININQSYFYYGKQSLRISTFSEIAKELNVPFISVNSVGVGDILKNIVIFDGSSLIINKYGKVVKQFNRFEEDSKVLNFYELEPIEPIVFFKYTEIVQAILFEQREFFRLNGIKKAQVHISGGLDSAIVAALVAKSMGPENCVFITNPSKLNTASKSFEYAETLCKKLGVRMYENPIQSIYEEFMRTHIHSFDWEDLNSTGKASVQAVMRTVQGLAASHHFGSGIVATGNHTEIVLGWASFHDIGSIGVHAILGDLSKVELYNLAAWINVNIYGEEIIPEDLYNGNFKPAAELPDANEDPIDYTVQSGICSLLIRERVTKSFLMNIYDVLTHTDVYKDYFKSKDVLKYSKEEWEEQIDFAMKAMKRSVYKAAQGAPIVIISPRSRGFSNRETLINKYNG